MAEQIAVPVKFGPMFAGDTGPAISVVLLWDSGGYVNLGGEAYVEGIVRRWDPRRKAPLGPELARAPMTIVNASKGEAEYDWALGSPASAVPVDPGWYVIQVSVLFPSGREQLSQRAIFEVYPSARAQ
jgi:hypothetical protein